MEKIKLCIVGAGNIWRGAKGVGMDRCRADNMGMLATIMNGQALQDALEVRGLDTRLQTSIEMRQIAELYIRRKAVRHLEKGRVVIFSGGTGNPFFSTDTCAALRATEINAEIILFGKTIDGVYDDDPKTNPNAKKIDKISYADIIRKDLKVMDTSACALCKQNNIPIIVFDFKASGSLVKIMDGKDVGTYIS